MLKFFRLLTVLSIALYSCIPSLSRRIAPEYKDVDPQFAPIVNEYLGLAKLNDITLNHRVTIGFKKLDSSTVGVTNYGLNFREIDIDPDYWSRCSPIAKITVLYHELSHAYCFRKHDHDSGVRYEDPESLNQFVNIRFNRENGYFEEDGCPVSILYPTILDDHCLLRHYAEYTQEMFTNCVPY